MGITDSIGRGFGLSGQSIGKGFEFAKKNWAQIYKYLLLSQIVVWIFAAVGAGIFLGLTMLLSGVDSLVMVAVGGAIFAVLLLAGMSCGIACSLGGTQFSLSGKKAGYFERGNILLALKWVLFVACALLVAALIIGGLIYAGVSLMSSVNWVAGALVLALAAILLIMFLICAFMVSFYAAYEVAIARKGPINAVVSSFRLFRENFWETAVFMIFLGAIGFFLYIAAEIIYYFIYLVAILLSFINPILSLIGIAVALLVLLLIRVLIDAFMLPMQVRFYDCMVRCEQKGGMETGEKKKDKVREAAPEARRPFRRKPAA